MRSRNFGVFQVALSGFFFGLLGTIGKTLYAYGMTPGELLTLRYGLAGLMLWPVIWWRHPRAWRLPAPQVAVCTGLGIGGYALFSNCFFLALQGLSASLAVLLLYTYPVIVTAVAWLAWGDRVPRRKLPALPLMMAGIVLLVWGEWSVEKLSALGLGVAAAVVYSGYILISSRRLRGIPPLISLTYILTAAGIALAVIHLQDLQQLAHLVHVVGQAWGVIVVMVVFSTVGAMGLFLAGLQKLRPWEVSLLSMLEPVTGMALAAFVLGERLTLTQSLGAIGVLGGMVVVSLPSTGSLKTPSVG